MIDNLREVQELIRELNEHLPLRAYATRPLVHSLRAQGTNIKVNDAVMIDSVLYLGDDGGVACSLALPGKTNVVTSITHLSFDDHHALARRIQAYQERRSQRLAGPVGRGSKTAEGSLVVKPKPKRGRVASSKAATKRALTARFQAACRLWQAGDFQRAANSFREVFEANAEDPCFSRYWLASSLFQAEAFDELDALLTRYDDHSGVWRFAQALAAFRRQGDTEDSQRLLVEADHLEPGFEDFLLRDTVVDASHGVRFDVGPGARAIGCARLFLPAWRAAPGAASWARRILKVPPVSANPNDMPRRFPQDQLRALPLRRETWQVGLARHSGKASDEQVPPLWIVGVANIAAQEMRVLTVIDQPLADIVVWNELLQAFVSPMEGVPARPTTLIVGRSELRVAWGPLLSEIGIDCQYESDPQPIGQMLQAMGAMMKEHDQPAAEDVDIREFPQTNAIWQADFIRSPAWVMNEQEGAYRPWTVVILDKASSAALTTTLVTGEPTPALLLDFLVRTMARSALQSALRPRLVEVSNSDCYDYVRPRLEAAGIDCQIVDEMKEFNEFCLQLAKGIDGSEKCALAEGQGVTRAHMESFFEAAAYYFRQAPWRGVPGEVPIEIRCTDPPMGTRYAIVLGRTGVQLGLCIYDDWATTRATLAGDTSPNGYRALAVCYDEAQIMAAVDLQLIDRLGWPIAAPEAWPAVMRLKPGHTPCSANVNELVFLDACLRAIPDFLKANVKSQTRNVATGTRTVDLSLAWV